MGKGENFERETCKELSLWWTHKSDDSVFWRTSQSGGRRTQRQKGGKKTPYSAGDVGLLHPKGRQFLDFFVVELKRGYSKTIDVLSFVDWKFKKNGPILQQWFEKSEEEKREVGRREVLVIFKRDRHMKCVMISKNLGAKIKKLTKSPIPKPFMSININHQNFYVLRYNLFFQWMSPETVKTMWAETINVKRSSHRRNRRKL